MAQDANLHTLDQYFKQEGFEGNGRDLEAAKKLYADMNGQEALTKLEAQFSKQGHKQETHPVAHAATTAHPTTHPETSHPVTTARGSEASDPQAVAGQHPPAVAPQVPAKPAELVMTLPQNTTTPEGAPTAKETNPFMPDIKPAEPAAPAAAGADRLKEDLTPVRRVGEDLAAMGAEARDVVVRNATAAKDAAVRHVVDTAHAAGENFTNNLRNTTEALKAAGNNIEHAQQAVTAPIADAGRATEQFIADKAQIVANNLIHRGEDQAATDRAAGDAQVKAALLAQQNTLAHQGGGVSMADVGDFFSRAAHAVKNVVKDGLVQDGNQQMAQAEAAQAQGKAIADGVRAAPHAVAQALRQTADHIEGSTPPPPNAVPNSSQVTQNVRGTI